MTSEEQELFKRIQNNFGSAVEKNIGDIDIVKMTDPDEFCVLGKGHELYFEILMKPCTEEEYYSKFEYKPVKFEDLPIIPKCTKDSLLHTRLYDGDWKGKTVEETVEHLINWYYKDWYPESIWDTVRDECSKYTDEKLIEVNATIDRINSSLPWNAKPWKVNKNDDGIIMRLFFIDDDTAYTLRLGRYNEPRTEDGIKYLMGMNDREEYARDKIFLAQQDICFHVRDYTGKLANNDEKYGNEFLKETRNRIKTAIDEKRYYNLYGKALNGAVDELYCQFNHNAAKGKYYVSKSEIKKLIQQCTDERRRIYGL